MFVPGMTAFAMAHLFYIQAFGFTTWQLTSAGAAYTAGSLLYFRLFFPHIQENIMLWLVGAYVLLFTNTLWRSSAALLESSYKRHAWYAFLGVVSFAVSDAILGLNNFYFDVPTLPSYLLYQFLYDWTVIVMSLCSGILG